MTQDDNYFKEITVSAFGSYEREIHKKASEVMSKKNPYGDLEDGNTYRETDRWKK